MYNLIKKKAFSFINRNISIKRSFLYKDYPKQDFELIHTEACKVLPTREILLEYLPKNGIIAEIGVSKGAFASLILKVCDPQKLYLIDQWLDRNDFQHLVQEKFKDEILNEQVCLLKKDSVQAISEFDDQFFDWVYLDTTHELVDTKNELQSLKSKIKDGGLIAGHDYINGNWNNGLRYGVQEAVREFCIAEGWQLVYLTQELRDNPSFVIKKIDK